MSDEGSDILVIGGGMAGVSIAAHLAQHAMVKLLEMEDQPGYHSTGRSAALFSETYGNAHIRALSRASRPFFFSPPADFAAGPLVNPRTVLIFGREGQEQALEAYPAAEGRGDRLEVVGPDRARSLCPFLRREGLLGGVVERDAADIEVHELLQGYLRLFRARGGALSTGVRASAVAWGSAGWTVESRDRAWSAPIVVNAAGAWAGEIGAMAGAAPIGLEPRRRTAALVEAPTQKDWPMIVDVDEAFYAKPDAGLLLVSPADETPSAPCDAQPEDIDVAIAIDRLETATTLEIRRVRSKWAGLRSFVGDRTPVVGFDPQRPGFFWTAALGGYGIQTAPALSRLAANLVLGRPLEADIAACGVQAPALSPARLLPHANSPERSSQHGSSDEDVDRRSPQPAWPRVAPGACRGA